MTDWKTMAEQAAIDVGHPNPKLFARQMQQESGFSEDVIYGRRSSSAGAQGIAQFMPDTAKSLGVNPLDPAAALHAAARLMKNYYEQYGRWDTSLAAYNAGPGNVEKYGGVPPFEETQRYVKNILGQQEKAPKAPGMASLINNNGVGTGTEVGKMGIESPEAKAKAKALEDAVRGGGTTAPPSGVTAPTTATPEVVRGPAFTEANLQTAGLPQWWIDAYLRAAEQWKQASILAAQSGKNIWDTTTAPGQLAAQAFSIYSGLEKTIQTYAKPDTPQKPDRITQSGTGNVYEFPPNDLGPGQEGPPPPPRLVLPGTKTPAEPKPWQNPTDGSVIDLVTGDMLSPAVPGWTPGLGVRWEPQGSPSEWARVAQDSKEFDWRKGTEFPWTQETWNKTYGQNQQKIDMDAVQNEALRKQWAEQNEQSKNQLASSMADWMTKSRLDASKWAMLPGQEYFLGAEPSGVYANIARMNNRQFDPNTMRPQPTDINPEDAWRRAQSLTRGGK